MPMARVRATGPFYLLGVYRASLNGVSGLAFKYIKS